MSLSKNVNNYSYRNGKFVYNKIDHIQRFSSPTLLTPSSAFSKPIVISNNKTASGSVVMKIKVRHTKRYIIVKINPHTYPSLHEYKMYTIVNSLIKRKICPYLIQSFELENKFIQRDRLHPYIKKHLKFKQGAVLINETYSPLNTLQKVNLQNPLHIFFQVLYTLECFRRIGFSHNDLHHANIFIIQLKGRGNLYNRFEYKSDKTNTKRVFYLPTKGQHVRIYDFDRGSSYTKAVHPSLQISKAYKKTQSAILSEYFGKFYAYADKNRDIHRFLFPFLDKQTQTKEKHIALQLFNLHNQSNYTRSNYPNTILDKCSKELLAYDYFVNKLSHKPVHISRKNLPSLDDMIMSYVFDPLTVLPPRAKIHTTYKIKNIR